jgi:broad specificity phosphatase PhoE
MATRLKLICHASTAAVRASAFPADEALDLQGRQRLARLVHRKHYADKYLTSPALRAIQTAEALNLPAIVEPTLQDCDYGSWAGQTLEEVQAREPEAVAEWLRDPGAAPHGGESVLALIKRVAEWLDAQMAAPGKIVAVTHPSVIRAATVHAIEAGPESFWRIDVAPLSVTRLTANNGRWTLAVLAAMEAESTGP